MNKLTIDHAALILGVSRATIYNWIASGDVPKDPSEIVRVKIEEMEARLCHVKDNLSLVKVAYLSADPAES